MDAIKYSDLECVTYLLTKNKCHLDYDFDKETNTSYTGEDTITCCLHNEDTRIMKYIFSLKSPSYLQKIISKNYIKYAKFMACPKYDV